MQFQIHEDIDAELQDVYEVITDFDTIERSALRRGIEARRLSPAAPVGQGTEWRVKFGFRGTAREASITMVALDAPNSMSFESNTEGLQVPTTIELVALSRTTTRMSLSFELKATNLAARLLVQSIKLARGTLEKKLQARFASLAKDIEGRVAEAL